MAIFLAFALSAALASPTCRPLSSTSLPADASSFAALQRRYQHLAPPELMAQPVLEAAEQAAKASTGSDKYKRAAYVSLAVYRAQLIYLKSVCIASRQQTYSPDELIEISYAAVIAPDRNTALRLLPESFALNLTPRVAVVGLALACSKSTPALGALLATFAIPCGTTSGMGANNSFKPNLLRSSKSVAKELATLSLPLRKSA